MANFDPVNLAVRTICPNNLVKVDDTGLPSVLVFIPKFKNSDVLNGGDDSTHPAFIVNGQEIAGFYYSKYQNCVYSGAAYSLPGENPAVLIDFDTAIDSCKAKGNGWHLGTNAEWAAIALWCKKNGFLPYGNNNSGKDSRENNYRAILNDNNAHKTKTGTGPLTWSHDKTLSGIWDLNGNVWEWQGGVRLVWGELQIKANNDAADSNNTQGNFTGAWMAINAADGSLVDPESRVISSSGSTSGSTVKLDYVGNVLTYSTEITNVVNAYNNCLFSSIVCTDAIGEATKALLRALALLPDEGAEAASYEGDCMYWNNSINELILCRGGAYATKEKAGVFTVYFYNDRDYVGDTAGFRSAYIPELDQ